MVNSRRGRGGEGEGGGSYRIVNSQWSSEEVKRVKE